MIYYRFYPSKSKRYFDLNGKFTYFNTYLKEKLFIFTHN